jgi:aspartate ammonia-lyase
MTTRLEHDFLGERQIPSTVYYGIQTLRAMENFAITGIPIKSEPLFVQALAYVKKGAALANKELGVLPADIADAIVAACDRVASGEFNDQFLTDMIQGGEHERQRGNCQRSPRNNGPRQRGIRLLPP